MRRKIRWMVAWDPGQSADFALGEASDHGCVVDLAFKFPFGHAFPGSCGREPLQGEGLVAGCGWHERTS
ncbi:hypothetical protein [Mycolicibacterium fortuitum]|uniref:hypothetical protein n=1 Tax=Mycolicibacterium fortuitum TaxID=1766 RepID=UPI0035585C36